MRYTANSDEAKDLLHDGFLKVFENIKNFNYSGSFEGWVRRIMINTTIDHYRKNKNIFTRDAEEFKNLQNEEPDYDVLSKLRVEEILKAVQSLSPAYKAVFNLYVIEGYSHKDIAEELGITVGTSKSNLAKAKNNLKKMFNNVEYKEFNELKY